MRKIHFSIIVILMAVMCNLNMKAAINTNDSLRLVNFLNSPSIENNVTNGQQLNSQYNPNNPNTWGSNEEFVWIEDISEELRIVEIRIPNKNLSGTLNLQGCDSLRILNFNYNSIVQLNVTGCKKLDTLTFISNRLENIDLADCTELSYLNCDNNFIAQLNLSNCTKLETLKCRLNNLTFFELLMPTVMPTKCLIGEQRPYKPDEVIAFSNRNVSKGFTIDLTKLKADPNTISWRYNSPDGPEIPPALITKVGDRFTFNESLLDSAICCVMWNGITHKDMKVPTLVFELSYNYNETDLTRLQMFLNSPSAIPNVRNGFAINPNFVLNDPKTFNVKWEPVGVGVAKENRLVEIYEGWTNKRIAGHFDLTGTQYLKTIIVSGNELTGFSFSPTTNVEYFNLANNKVKELDINMHTKLVQLECPNNQITRLNLSKNLGLTNLNCNDNEITELIGLADLKSLRDLRCQNNNLTVLDIANLTNLIRVDCDNNKISELATERLLALNILHANNNQIDSIDLTHSVNLQRLAIKNNGLRYLDLSTLKNVVHLVCDSNELNFRTLLMPNVNISDYERIHLEPQDTIARELFHKMGDIWVANGGIVMDLSGYIPTRGNTYLEWKRADGTVIHRDTNNGRFTIPNSFDGQMLYCELTNDNFPNLVLRTVVFRATYLYNRNDVAKLRAFLDEFSKFGDEENGRTNGREINAVRGLPAYNPEDPATFPVTWTVRGSEKRLELIDWSDIVNIKGIIDLANCNSLTYINLACESNIRRNAVSALILDGCNSLVSVRAPFNQLENVSFRYCTNIEELDVSSNIIASEILIPSRDKIKRINISDNKIPTMNLSGCPQLVVLNVSENKLKTLNLAGNVAIVDLNCANNELTSLSLTDNINIANLHCANNALTSINLTNQKILQNLHIDNNLLSALNFSNSKELISLSCRNNNIAELDFTGVEHVTFLQADNNRLTFTTIKYDKIPNEVFLNPQAAIVPNNLDANCVLTSDTLDLSGFCEIPDNATVYTLKKLNGEIVASNLYKLHRGVYSDFSKDLKGLTLYCEMTNSKFPGLVLTTVRFNTTPPERYNANDVSRLRVFLDSPSKNSGVTNGRTLSPAYRTEDPSTFPVVWKPFNDEYRVTVIRWESANLNGDLYLTHCAELDTLVVTGQNLNKSGISRLVLDGCVQLRYLDCRSNSLRGLTLTNLTRLDYINCSLNSMDNLEFSNTNSVRTLNCSNNNFAELNLNNLTSLSNFDCSNNYLIFAKVRLQRKPDTFLWEPQAKVIPAELVYSSGYQLKKNMIDLRGYGDYIIYELYSDSGDMIHENTSGVFMVEDLDGRTVYVEMTSMQNYFNGFKLRTVTFTVDLSNSVEDIAIIPMDINIYPNPTSDFATISLELLSNIGDGSDDLEINIYDITSNNRGMIYSGNYTHNITFSTHHLPSGFYYLHFRIGDRRVVRMLNIQR